MENLLKETLDVLSKNGKTIQDVKWIGSETEKVSIDEFLVVADKEYDSGYGGQEVADDLLIVGDNWWLERHEYDGSEWWEYKELPIEPSETIKLYKLITYDSLKSGNRKRKEK